MDNNFDSKKLIKNHTANARVRKQPVEKIYKKYKNKKVDYIRQDVQSIGDGIKYEDFVSSNQILLSIPLTESKEMVWAKWRNQFGRWYVLYEIVQTLDTIKVFPKLRLNLQWIISPKFCRR